MPVWSEQEKNERLVPDHELLREIECSQGEVELELLYEPRPHYGQSTPRLRRRGRLGIWLDDPGTASLTLSTDLLVELMNDHHSAWARETMRAGMRRYCSLTYSENDPSVLSMLGEEAHARVDRSIRWWQEWASRCTYGGPHRSMVVRSLLTLKLLAYAPSGAIVAAPTTSLPENVRGPRNWDYRYCWLRDASFTMRALLSLGYPEEGQAFLGWMTHATRLSRPYLRVMYNVFGENTPAERELDHLEGYQQSRPVRIGNGASGQLQLDVYGEVADAAAEFATQGGSFDSETTRLLRGIGDAICKLWQQPDAGIWELRAGPFHHTHSKVLCWTALHRLIGLHKAGLIRVNVDHLRATADKIRAEIEEHGYNPGIESYTRVYDGSDVDASLLVLPYFGYVAGDHDRMRSTMANVQRTLSRDGLVYRYQETLDDGLPRGEGAFGVCSFWAVDCLARSGEKTRAEETFAHLLTYANDVGLFAEEIDPDTGAHLGNFPQAFTHIGLINAALTLLAGEEKRELQSEPPIAQPDPTAHPGPDTRPDPLTGPS
jgi:GH15 family glucan-1,4-alpha-glucosidase